MPIPEKPAQLGCQDHSSCRDTRFSFQLLSSSMWRLNEVYQYQDVIENKCIPQKRDTEIKNKCTKVHVHH